MSLFTSKYLPTRRGSLLRIAWLTLFGITILLAAYPVNIGAVRLFLLAAWLGLLLGATGLLWGRKKLRLVPPACCLALLLFLCLPGRSPAADRLRNRYANCLRQYEGVVYAWGGESASGIDCSGLVRRGFIRASLQESLLTLNPRLLRGALDVWLHDCSAKALRDGYRDWTIPLNISGRIDQLRPEQIATGDIAATTDGKHVLVYLGDGEWIEADPGLHKVVRIRVASDSNPWFHVPVQIVRWRVFG